MGRNKTRGRGPGAPQHEWRFSARRREGRGVVGVLVAANRPPRRAARKGDETGCGRAGGKESGRVVSGRAVLAASAGACDDGGRG